jgi:hypothetical protein
MVLREIFRRDGRRAASTLALLACGAVLNPGWILGCASQGPLQPPSLHLPAPAERLTAERRGDQVVLDWTTPAKTTDGELIQGAMAADVCLDLAPEEAPAAAKKAARVHTRKAAGQTGETQSACLRVAHLAVAPGLGHAVVDLGALATGAPRLVAYQIELENARGRSAGVSAAAFVAAGAAPPPVTGLRVTPRREAALVAWKAEPGRESMELKRTLVATAAGPVAAAAAERGKGPPGFTPGAPKGPAREVVLRAEGSEGTDAGGMIDTTVRDGDSYIYVAQRVATVTLGEHTLELRGRPSAAVPFAFRDIFPPQVPTGLVLVPGGGFGEPASIDLVWDANFEPDLLGYNVYRSQDGGSFERLNPAPLTAPAYRDLQVEAGPRYTYRVTAIDQRQNESAPSVVASESLRK